MNQSSIDVEVLCNNCMRSLKLKSFRWFNGIVTITVDPCKCSYDTKMEEFNKQLEELI